MAVNRTELVAEIAKKAGLSKTEADGALSAFQEILIDSLKKGETVKVTGLMNVERVSRAARTGRNPRSKETIQIPASQTPVFKAGKALKDAVAK